MEIFLDTADTDFISEAYLTGLIDGVTTNPTLILRSGRHMEDVIRLIHESFPLLESISVEVVADTAEEMLSEASAYYSQLQRITIKLPCTVEGLKACASLSRDGISTNVTLVFSLNQAILASKAGATYISPFVGRWYDNSVDGIGLIKSIRQVFDRSGTSTKILAASIRDAYLVEQVALAGADVATIPPAVFWVMFKNVLTERGLEIFEKDWNEAISKRVE